jgi:hypothetical protein
MRILLSLAAVFLMTALGIYQNIAGLVSWADTFATTHIHSGIVAEITIAACYILFWAALSCFVVFLIWFVLSKFYAVYKKTCHFIERKRQGEREEDFWCV